MAPYKICPKCGNVCNVNDQFCAKCGNAMLTVPPAGTGNGYGGFRTYQYTQPPKKGSNAGLIVGIILGVLAVVLVISILFTALYTVIYRVISSNGKNNFGDYDDYSYSQDYDDPFENNEHGGNDWLFGGE